MTYAPVNGLQLYYEIRGSGRPLVLLHGGLLTIELSFGPLLEPLAAGRRVIAVELQGHGHTADTGRPMTIEALAGDVVALLDHLGITEADLFGFSLGGLVAYAVALSAPARVGKLIVASADAHRPPGRESTPLGEDRMPTPADFQAMRDAYHAVAPDPAHFEEFAARTSAMVHEFPGWTDELRSLQVPTLLIFGDRDFSPLPDVVEMFELLPDAQLAVLPGTTHVGVTRRPGEVLALITPFLDRDDPGRPELSGARTSGGLVTFQIRPLGPDDYPLVISVIDQWWGGRAMAGKLPRLFFEHFTDTSFAAERDGRLAGFLAGFISQSRPGEAYI